MTLHSVKDPRQARQVILNQSTTVRQSHHARLHHADIERRRAGAMAISMPSEQPYTTQSYAHAQLSLVEQLRDLGSLRDSGVLTEEEFLAQKSRLLTAIR